MKKIALFLIALLHTSLSYSKSNYSLADAYIEKLSNCIDIYSDRIIFCGSDTHRERVEHLLHQVALTSIGLTTLNTIIMSGNKTLIMHESASVFSAGKTLAPLTSKLTNGVGSDSVIQMNFSAPLSGTHLVTNKKNELIPFPMDVNFLHELSHARHKTDGTLWLVAVEEQAVIDENIYRQEVGVLNGQDSAELRDLRFTDNDIQVWSPPN